MYPVGRGPNEVKARANTVFSDVRKVPALFQVITRRLGLDKVTDFSDEQKLLVYGEYKKLIVIDLSPLDGKYKFSLYVPSKGPYEDTLGFLIEGIIDDQGTVTISKKESRIIVCPTCLSGATLIATPRGPIPVRDLRIGVAVWTIDRSGTRHQAPIIRTSKTPVAVHHEMVDLVLDDGRELIASPGHPTIDGRMLGALSAGDSLEGRQIVSARRIPYTEGYTYDILPAGETGAYWADGILVGSTLSDNQAKHAIHETGKSARP